MAEGRPILSGKSDHQKIGYIEGTDAFDSLGNKRCKYNPSTGNLLELDSGRTIGHVSLAGYFVGSSWIAEELFPLAQNLATTSPDKPGAGDYAALVIPPDAPMTVEPVALVTDEAVTADLVPSAISSDNVVTVGFTALATSLDMPVATGPVALATPIYEASAADFAASNASVREPTAPGPASFKAFSQESTPVEPAAPSTTSLEDTAVAESVASANSPDESTAAAPLTETLLSINMEQQLHEMIRMTLAMKSVEPGRQTVKDVAGRMREHLVSLRRQRPRAGVVKMADFRGQRQSRPNDLRS
ncbi:MAG: hypothetical protein WA858_09305 [Xanthobacteraceae bacterium]|jgi:hypothetical protein